VREAEESPKAKDLSAPLRNTVLDNKDRLDTLPYRAKILVCILFSKKIQITAMTFIKVQSPPLQRKERQNREKLGHALSIAALSAHSSRMLHVHVCGLKVQSRTCHA
jgi:hypothetical protein